MAGSLTREHLILYQKQIRISGVIAFLLGVLFIVAALWGIEAVFGDSRVNYLAGAVLIILAYLMLR